MRFNKQILKHHGITGFNNKQLLNVLKTKLEYLTTHNKNYTTTQWLDIQDINDIIQALEA